MAQQEEQPQPSPGKRTKRAADRQVTKDDYEDLEANEGEEAGPGTFQKANEEKLKARRILKVVGVKGANSGVTGKSDAEKSSKNSDLKTDGSSGKSIKTESADKVSQSKANANPFAAVSFGNKEIGSSSTSNAAETSSLSFNSSSSNNKSPFASIATSSGFGFGSSSNTNDQTKENKQQTSGFGTIASAPASASLSYFSSGNSNPFAAAAKTSSGFGTFGSSSVNEDKDITPASPTIASNDDKATNNNRLEQQSAILQAESNVVNGEEEEECMMECRAKLFRLTKKIGEGQKSVGMSENDGNSAPVAASQSGPPNLSSLTNKKDEEDDTKGDDDKAKDDKGGKDDNKTAKPECSNKAKNDTDTEWREVGIGPVRLLRTKTKKEISTRVVMRRETHPGGSGTKVILNVKLIRLANVSKSGDKFLRLTLVAEENKPVNYLFKVKTVDHVNQLMKHMKTGIAEAANDSKS